MELKVFVGMFRYTDDGVIEHIVTTTRERVTQDLIAKMRYYLEWCGDSHILVPNNYQSLKEIGWEYGYYEVDIEQQVVLSEQHILKHLIRQSSRAEQ